MLLADDAVSKLICDSWLLALDYWLFAGWIYIPTQDTLSNEMLSPESGGSVLSLLF
ncbi:MAG TPA: hypothetical protein VL728_18495 [Cyclobacteriaceae bacterium]|jgi:hypothetical protein|nr:hypothetical protein [Cyclobacteriaceae bacterium]